MSPGELSQFPTYWKLPLRRPCADTQRNTGNSTDTIWRSVSGYSHATHDGMGVTRSPRNSKMTRCSLSIPWFNIACFLVVYLPLHVIAPTGSSAILTVAAESRMRAVTAGKYGGAGALQFLWGACQSGTSFGRWRPGFLCACVSTWLPVCAGACAVSTSLSTAEPFTHDRRTINQPWRSPPLSLQLRYVISAFLFR